MDTTDRELIGMLRADGRASISALAQGLGVSRATAKARLDRLLESGAIRRFTVELESPEAGLIRAVTMIELQGRLSRAVVRALRKLPEIASLHTTNGAWDLVAQIETRSLPQFDKVLREIREIPGVVNSQTSLLLDTAGA